MKSSEADGLDLFKFKGAVIELCLGEGHELPTEKDITMVSPDVAGSFVHRVSFCVCCYLLCSAPFSLTPPPNRSIVRLTSIPWNAQAFETADMDKSGLVDEEEFLELYSHVKDGNVKGLAGGYFSKKKKIVVKAAVAKSDPDSFEAKARQADLKAKEAAAKAAAAEKKAAEDKAAAAAKAKAAEEEAAAKKASEAKVAQDAAIVKAAKKGSKFMALLKVWKGGGYLFVFVMYDVSPSLLRRRSC
jgi:hypothetical protein